MGLKEEGKTSMTGEEAQTIIGNLPIYGDDCYSITEYQEAKAMAIKALETLEEFERAQIITGGRLNGRTYAYKCGLKDGIRKALNKEPCEGAISRDTAMMIVMGANDSTDAIRQIQRLPSATPIRPKGEWIEIVDEETAYSKTWHYECSECGKHNTCFDDNPYFCPHCGADMRGKKDEID